MAIERKGRIGLMTLDDKVDRVSNGLQSGIVEASLRKDRRIASGHEKHVALAHGNLELLRQVKNHLAAGPGPPSLEKTQMPGRNVGFEGEIELTQSSPLAPAPQVLAYVNLLNIHGWHGKRLK